MIKGAAVEQFNRGWRLLGLVAAVAVLALPASSLAADASRRYALERSGFLQLKVPASWRDEVDANARPPVISFRPAAGKPFIVSVIPVQAGEGKHAPSRRELRTQVEQMAGSIQPFAVESSIKLKEFTGAAGPGFRFFATDSAPAADGYKYMTRGKLNVGNVSVTFTILTNDGQEAVIRAALAMLKSAKRVAR